LTAEPESRSIVCCPKIQPYYERFQKCLNIPCGTFERKWKILVDGMFFTRYYAGMINENISLDRETVEKMLQDLTESESLLMREAQTLEARIKSIRERMEILKAKLAATVKGVNGKKPRLRKGEGVAAILKILNGVDGIGLSQAQISEKTGISGSTVFRLLNKNPEKFNLGVDNLWRKKV
jgi:transcriptional regulator with XRE-family HTH domain